MHPRAGAVAVGARPFLIAWNINLDSDDVELAKRIARRVRESGGGLPKVQAQRLPDRGAGARPPGAQVSMNLLDFADDADVARLGRSSGSWPPRTASSWPSRSSSASRRWRRSCDVADHAGAPADEPVEARLEAAAAAIRLRDFSPLMALELRLAAAGAATPVGGEA